MVANTAKSCILCILTVLLPELCFGRESEHNQLKQEELQLAYEQLQHENAWLQQELSRKDEEIVRLRSLYADTILQINDTARQLTAMELEASSLLSERKSAVNEDLVSAVGVISALRQYALQSKSGMDELRRRLITVLDVLAPSDAMRKELEDGFANAIAPLDNALNLLAINPERDNGSAGGRDIEVIDLNPECQAVYLNAGFRNGLRIGQMLSFRLGEKTLARVRVVECRADVSAAIIIEGNWNALYAGCRLQTERIAR